VCRALRQEADQSAGNDFQRVSEIGLISCRFRRSPFDAFYESGKIGGPDTTGQARVPLTPKHHAPQEMNMRFMILFRANADSEAGVMLSEKLLTDLGTFTDELVNAGIMKVGEGLHPSKNAKRLTFTNSKITVTDGPFAETKELLASFWIWECASMDEAVAWAKRIPAPEYGDSEEGIVEIRQIFEMDDFGAESTPELREQEDRQRTQVEATA
jgi:hypothetical protein